ncbi:hypothetical protein ACFTXM_47195 [Streptomyces sp. NPDC056930]|uniref:hypothetical protein n=1 Tax=Streptomyces sp. NPDC056930 TaxID=3345967 RepID=UPI003630EE14
MAQAGRAVGGNAAVVEVWAAVDLGKEHYYCVVLEAQGERLWVQREFQPTTTSAEDAEGAAYADAVSEYAALGRDELREAARAVMAVTSGRG